MNTPLVTIHQERVNEVIKGRIQVVKVDSNNKEIPVQGAVFRAYNASDNSLVEEITSDIDGFAYTSDLRYGYYYFKELEAPVEFYLNENQYPFSIRENGKVVVQYIKNDSILIKLNINKTDGDTQQPLANAVFEVYNKETGEQITFEYLNDNFEIVSQSQLITNANGQAYTRGFLPYGTYEVREVQAPSGYVRVASIEFVVNRDTTFIDLAVIGATSILNVSNAQTQLAFIKLNHDGEAVENAQLQLVDSSGEEVALWSRGLTPFVIKGLIVGESYTLHKLVAPEGYLLAEPVTFTVEETAELITIEMIDDYVPELKTTALFDNGLKENTPSETMTVVDVVFVMDTTAITNYSGVRTEINAFLDSTVQNKILMK